MKNGDKSQTIDSIVEDVVRSASENNLSLREAFERAAVPYSLLTNKRAKKMIYNKAYEITTLIDAHKKNADKFSK